MVSKNFFFLIILLNFQKKQQFLKKMKNFILINDWRDNKTPKSLQKILNSYLRLAVSYARKYSSYGLPIDDLIHEGVLGIMHALKNLILLKILDFQLMHHGGLEHQYKIIF